MYFEILLDIKFFPCYILFRNSSKYLEVIVIGFQITFKALSDPVRREILTALKNGRMSAGDIASRFNLTNATISYHLSQLKNADLVFETRVKNFIYYELNTTVFDDLMLWIKQFSKEGS
jgi:ArsR family transcriptional regulator